jgi:hypothetical protein
MMRWFTILISLPLMGCVTPSKPRESSPLPLRITTTSEAKNAGLSSTELSDLEAFFDFVHDASRPGHYRFDPNFSREECDDFRLLLSNSFAQSFDPHFMLLENDQHLRLGLFFSPGSHRLHLLDPSILPAYNEVHFVRTRSGYDITYIQGCVPTPIKIVKTHGRPFITINRRD